MSLELKDFYKNYKNKYVFKNGAKLIKIWEYNSIKFLKINYKNKNHFFYIVCYGFENNKYISDRRMKLRKFKYDNNYKIIEICDFVPNKKFEKYFHDFYNKYEKEKRKYESIFNVAWHLYDKLEYYK